MIKLYEIREKMKELYSRHSLYILPLIRFVVALITLLVINSKIGFMSSIKSPAAAFLIAAICSVLPSGVTVVLIMLVILAHLYSLAIEVALATFVVMLVMFILYYRFSTKDGFLLILVPVVFFLKIPYILPLIVGLVFTPISIISLFFGTVLYYIMNYAKVNAVSISKSEAGLDKIDDLMKYLTSDKEMMLMIATLAIATLVVYFLRRASIDYSRVIAIVAGGLSELIIIVVTSFILDIEGLDSVWKVAIFCLLSIGIAYIVDLFILVVDYSRTEYVQFEDDEYYYYVKAIPKIKVTAPDVKVKHINVQRVNRR